MRSQTGVPFGRRVDRHMNCSVYLPALGGEVSPHCVQGRTKEQGFQPELVMHPLSDKLFEQKPRHVFAKISCREIPSSADLNCADIYEKHIKKHIYIILRSMVLIGMECNYNSLRFPSLPSVVVTMIS